MAERQSRATDDRLSHRGNNEVYRYVIDNEIKKILKETDGIGTAATQAGIIKELIDSGMLIKKGKNLISSLAARTSHSCPARKYYSS